MATINSSFIPTPGTRELGARELDLTALRQSINNIAILLNGKDSGDYPLSEILSCQAWFPNPALNANTPQQPIQRQAFRKVINFGALPNTATKSIPHGITINANTTFTHIYGCATDPSTLFIPLPYASPIAAENIAVFVDPVNVNVTTGSDRTAFTTTYIIVEYLQN
jgi:hypothetical protein